MANPPDLSSLAAAIRTKILSDVDDARTRQLGARIIQEYNVPARDMRKLARAVQLFAQRIKFFREYPEVNAAPWVTADWGIGDCDDKSRLIAAILKSFRIPVRLIYVTFRKKGNAQAVSHVYPEVQLDGQWLAMESVQPYPLGKSPLKVMDERGYPYTFFVSEI